MYELFLMKDLIHGPICHYESSFGSRLTLLNWYVTIKPAEVIFGVLLVRFRAIRSRIFLQVQWKLSPGLTEG